MKFYVQDLTGHSTLEFTNDDAGVKEAMEKFEALLKDGHTAATRKVGETDYTVVRNPNGIEEETTFLRPMQGG